MSIVMDPNLYDDRYQVSEQEWYRRALAHNNQEIHDYQSQYEKYSKLPQFDKEDLKYIETMIKTLFKERTRLSEKYLEAVKNNK